MLKGFVKSKMMNFDTSNCCFLHQKALRTTLCRRSYSSQRSVLGPKRLIYFFINNIFNLNGNCVLRTLKNSFAIFWA